MEEQLLLARDRNPIARGWLKCPLLNRRQHGLINAMPSPRIIVYFAILPSLSITTSTITSPLVPDGSCDRSGFGEGCATTRATVVSPSPNASTPDDAFGLEVAAVVAAATSGCTGVGAGS